MPVIATSDGYIKGLQSIGIITVDTAKEMTATDTMTIADFWFLVNVAKWGWPVAGAMYWNHRIEVLLQPPLNYKNHYSAGLGARLKARWNRANRLEPAMERQ